MRLCCPIVARVAIDVGIAVDTTYVASLSFLLLLLVVYVVAFYVVFVDTCIVVTYGF